MMMIKSQKKTGWKHSVNMELKFLCNIMSSDDFVLFFYSSKLLILGKMWIKCLKSLTKTLTESYPGRNSLEKRRPLREPSNCSMRTMMEQSQKL